MTPATSSPPRTQNSTSCDGEGTLRHAAEALDAHEPVRLDLAHDEAELVHMGEEHDAWRVAVALDRGDEVAEPVRLRLQAIPSSTSARRRRTRPSWPDSPGMSISSQSKARMRSFGASYSSSAAVSRPWLSPSARRGRAA